MSTGFGMAAIALLGIGLVRMDDQSTGNLRLGYIALGFAAICIVCAAIQRRGEG